MDNLSNIISDCIIISCIGGIYTVKCGDKTYKCNAKGTFRNLKIKPVAGDYCKLRIVSEERNDVYITEIKERKSILKRPDVANLDTIFITFSPVSPLVETYNIDKQIFSSLKNWVKPVLVITKCDLDKEKSLELYNLYSKHFKAFMTSSYNSSGIEELKKYIESETQICAFSGASGVGKSSLINSLFPDFEIKTDELSRKIQRGKNTTRETTLYEISPSHFICDTPGFTSFIVKYEEKKDSDFLNLTYPEIAKVKNDCLWRNCTHTKETGCAVLQGIENGDISRKRYENFLKIRENYDEN